jgi:prepilin-type N-terminal cleavage/methylation domain-containing protein
MLVKRQEPRVESQMRMVAVRSYSGSRLLTLRPRPFRGVTLIELLVVILIISILAALVLGVAAVATETARQAQTKHIVERLHTLLTEFYGTFKTRRVRLNPAVEAKINGDTTKTAAQKRQLLAEARLYALREIMLMEIPDRWSDVLLNALPDTNASNAVPLPPIYVDTTGSTSQTSGTGLYGRTPLAAAYLRRLKQIALNAVTKDQVDALRDNQGAECLYMIITLACGDGEARSQFKEADIGDTDGDGAPEFLDGWGNPINFLRWAPGFDSQIQSNANNLQLADKTSPTYWKTVEAKDHDPFDVYRVEQTDADASNRGRKGAFRLVPLIYSRGRDETFGIRITPKYVAWRPVDNAWPAGYMLVSQSQYPRLSPYYPVFDADDNTTAYLGTPDSNGTAADNIHNHLLGLR